MMMQHWKSMPGLSVSPPLVSGEGPSARALQQRLKKEISLKFSKKPRQDETNRSSPSPAYRRHSSLLLANPLTKSAFSLTDALPHRPAQHPLEPLRSAAKSLSSKKVLALAARQRYSSFDEGFFKTGAPLPERESPPPPQLQPRRPAHSSSLEAPRRVEQDTDRKNKFKLLLKERNSQYKSASERKIARIDSKIKALRQKQVYLESMLPVEKPKAAVARPQPKRYPFGEEELRERITKLANQLIRTVELYFNMYIHNNIVGGHFRKVEGYGARVRNVLMLDDARARRPAHIQELTNHFQVFRTDRSENFMEEDVGLLSTLSNFLLKLEKRYAEVAEGFGFFERKRKREEKEAFRKTRERFEQRMGPHEPINRINHFIEHRLRFDQTRREDYMANLEKRGVVLNLVERSRELVLRQKESAVKDALAAH